MIKSQESEFTVASGVERYRFRRPVTIIGKLARLRNGPKFAHN